MNEQFIFKDYGTTREEMNRTLNTIINLLDNGIEIDGVTGDDVCQVMLVLNSALNRVYGVRDEYTENF